MTQTCRQLAAAQAEPLAGTAPTSARRWLLIEYRGPWGSHVVRDQLGPELVRRLHDHGLGVLCVRTFDDRAPGESGRMWLTSAALTSMHQWLVEWERRMRLVTRGDEGKESDADRLKKIKDDVKRSEEDAEFDINVVDVPPMQEAAKHSPDSVSVASDTGGDASTDSAHGVRIRVGPVDVVVQVEQVCGPMRPESCGGEARASQWWRICP
ncbi:MAG: hypothetical protein EB027_02185 [Actinobacteria bacterium]|nr:hypothetical protein [Actinomycetota bacterium]